MDMGRTSVPVKARSSSSGSPLAAGPLSVTSNQRLPEPKAGKNRLHLDLYPTGRDNALPMGRRIGIVEAKVAELVELGASVQRRTGHDDSHDPVYFVVMQDPESNEFCVGSDARWAYISGSGSCGEHGA
jgi:Glyoxalase-like domain